jgi:spermidine synthase
MGRLFAFARNFGLAVIAASAAAYEESSFDTFPNPRTHAEQCKVSKFSEPDFFQICDPHHAITPDDVQRLEIACTQVKKALMAQHPWSIHVGVAIIASSSQPLPDFAAGLASAWGLSGDDDALLVLSSDTRDEHGKLSGEAGAAIAGGLLTSVGLRAWQAGLEQRMAVVLLSGVMDALEAGLSGLVELLGGSILTKDGKPISGQVLRGAGMKVAIDGLVKKKTKWQSLDSQTNECGQTRCKQLFLDDILQLSDRFEPYYHEAMALPALNALGADARRALILGGGDCGIASLALRFDTMEKVVLVDIDEEVTKTSKLHFRAVSAALKDDRFTAIHGDALKYVAEHQEDEFDLIIIDFSDEPIDGAWNVKFFEQIKNMLSPRGVLVQNVGTVRMGLQDLAPIHKEVFKSTWPVSAVCPDYFSPYILLMSTERLDPLVVDWSFWQRQNIATTYYSPLMHPHMFNPHSDLLTILGFKIPELPACPSPLPKQVEAGRPHKVRELDEDSGEEIWRGEHPQYKNLGAVKVFYNDMRGKKFAAWNKEVIPCTNGTSKKGCYHSLVLPLTEGEDSTGPSFHGFAEAVVLPAMNILGKKARRILVLGGGDGVMANLILKFSSVEHLTVVDINPKVVEAVNLHFPELSRALQDTRTHVIINDARQYLDGLHETFDGIFVNLAHANWKKAHVTTRVPLASSFVRKLKGVLSPHGVVVQDIGSLAAPRLALRRFTLHKTILENSWPMAFGTLSDTVSQAGDRQWRHAPRLLVLSSPSALDPLAVDWSIWQQANIQTTLYHASFHRALFVVPAEVAQLFASSPPTDELLCGSPHTSPTQGTYDLLDKVVNYFKYDLQSCQQELSPAFFEYISRFVLYPTYGSWEHRWKGDEKYFSILSQGSFVSSRYGEKLLTAVLTLACREELCAKLQEGLQKAIVSELGCHPSSWVPISPVTWQPAPARDEL